MMEKIIDRPVLSILFFVFIIIVGYYSFISMPIETVPSVEGGLPTLYIDYIWQGAAPDMILQKVLIPAESEVTQIKGVKKISSRAEQNVGSIEVEFVRDTRMNFAEVDLSERLNRIQRDLPREVQNPIIQQQTPDEFKARPLLKIGLYGENYSVYSIRKLAEKEIIPYLKSIPGLEKVDLAGGVAPEIKIQTKLERLKKFNLDIRQIQTSLQRHFFTKSSISFSKNSAEITLALTENPKKIEDIQDIIIGSAGAKNIYLKEVADVFMGYQLLTQERRYQGKPYVQIDVFKEPKASLSDTAKLVKNKLLYLAHKLPEIKFIIQSDESKLLERQLMKLGWISLLVLLVIFVILILIIRDIKASLLVFSSVFFSVFATFTFIFLFKIPLNLLTLSGLSLGFGMFVDNAVVVFDSILRFREHGAGMRESAIEGPRAVIMPVLASTLTHIIVFFSFALVFRDRLRVFYLPLAYIITIALLSSVVVAYISIPSMAARIKLTLKPRKNEELFSKGRFFPYIIKYPLVVMLPIIAIFAFSSITFFKEVSFGRFFSWSEEQRVFVRLQFPTGAEFEDVKRSIMNFEKTALDKPYRKEINTSITRNTASMTITFPPDVEATSLPIQLKQELVGMATNLAGVGILVSGFDQEPYYYSPDTGSNLPFNIRLTGYNFEKLMEYSNDLKKTLLRHKRINEAEIQTDMRFWWGGREKCYSFRFDPLKLKIYNLPPSYINYLIRTMLREGTEQVRVKYDEKEMGVEIKASDVEDLELDDILNKYYYNVEGTPFRLRDIVTVEFTNQKGGITRENQEYQAMVQWDYLGSAKSGDRFYKSRYDSLVVPPGFKKSQEQSQFRMTQEEEGQLLLAVLYSVLLIYMILVMLYEDFFQPLLIMLAIPLALIGVAIAFVVMDYAFDSSAYIGIILLFGIVVSNSIILVDNINRHLKDSQDLIKSIIIGAKERIRPVFMTSATTVFGMLPMVLFRESSGNNSADIWSSLALCTVGGLTSSAILILLVLPIFYYYFYKFREHLFRIRLGKKNA